MRAHHRLTFAIFTSASVAILTIASSTLSFAQAPVAKQSAARSVAPRVGGNPAVGKAQAKGDANPPLPKAVVDPEAQRKMEELLVRWEAKSKLVKSLKVTYTRKDTSVLFDTKTIYQGQARLAPDRIYLDFYEVVDGAPKGAFDQRIVSDGLSVYQFLGPTKQIFVYPLDRDPKMKALNQGPLPFLFNMSVAKAKERYDMFLIPETEGTNPDGYIIKIIPKLLIDREEYSQALVKLDKVRFVPTAIQLTAPDGKDTKLFTFGKDALVENWPSGPEWFDGKAMANDLLAKNKALKKTEVPWRIEVNPGSDAVQPRNVAAPGANPKATAPAGTVGAKPAAKGTAVRQK